MHMHGKLPLRVSRGMYFLIKHSVSYNRRPKLVSGLRAVHAAEMNIEYLFPCVQSGPLAMLRGTLPHRMRTSFSLDVIVFEPVMPCSIGVHQRKLHKSKAVSGSKSGPHTALRLLKCEGLLCITANLLAKSQSADGELTATLPNSIQQLNGTSPRPK